MPKHCNTNMTNAGSSITAICFENKFSLVNCINYLSIRPNLDPFFITLNYIFGHTEYNDVPYSLLPVFAYINAVYQVLFKIKILKSIAYNNAIKGKDTPFKTGQ